MQVPDPTLIFKNISRHIQLNEHEQAYFISLLQVRELPRKSHLLRQGEICRHESFVLEGCLRSYTTDENGTDHIVMFGPQDWWISDLASFLSQRPASYSIDALEDSTLLQISKTDLEKLYSKVPKFERFFRLLLQNAFVAQQDRIQQNLSFTAELRYLNFIKKYPRLEQLVSQKQIASYLDITPVFLSMIRRKLSRR